MGESKFRRIARVCHCEDDDDDLRERDELGLVRIQQEAIRLTLKKEKVSVRAKLSNGGEAYITTDAVVQYKQKVLSFSR
jgi:hypothetical protein